MSFSSDVKSELAGIISGARHCGIAEITAIISLCGKVNISDRDQYSLQIHTENVTVARKYFTLLKKTFNINTEISIRHNKGFKNNKVYMVIVKKHEDAMRILQAAKLIRGPLQIEEDMAIADNLVIQSECCKRAFIRGAFLASGSISTPEKFYHFEIACTQEEKAQQIRDILNSFPQIESKIVKRKKYFVVYLKEGTQIVDVLNIMGAHVSLMKMENIRILKDMRNSVNRKVNCETANINKTVNAAMKQIEDIRFIDETIGLGKLSEGLEETARIRLEHPDVPLKELGMLLTPQVGKSGVNHRLRKLSHIAEELRDNKEEKL